jgi:nucleoside-triphosphatase
MIACMKRNLLLTGAPGVGKTTLVRRVLDNLPPGVASGFFTCELREEGRRLGFAVKTLAGQSEVLAHVNIDSSYRVGRYGVDLAAFERLALPAIDPDRVGASLLVIDEIGKMECFSDRFRKLVVAALGSDRAVLATIALRGNQFIQGLKQRSDVCVLQLTQQNRGRLIQQVTGWAQEVLGIA